MYTITNQVVMTEEIYYYQSTLRLKFPTCIYYMYERTFLFEALVQFCPLIE